MLIAFDLTREDLDRILAALGSHVYWHLSDQPCRNQASVLNPASNDPKQAAEIAACRELAASLHLER